ncbi:MAG: phosphotransferase [Trueperaceae bacterium]
MARLDLSPLVPWAAARLGAPLVAVEDVSWDHAASSVARLRTADGRTAYLKRHAQARKHRQERSALERWAVALPGTPRLLATTDEPAPALLLSAVPGALVEGLALDRDDELAVHHAAGSWLARLHALPFEDDDPVPLHAALEARLASWTARAKGAVAPETASWVAERLATAEGLAGSRVPCHRDFGPRNWLWDRAAGLGLIDFEHARPDVRWADVLRLIDGPWLGRADLEEAFWAGYGRRPRPIDRDAVDALRALHAIGTVAWGTDHDDAAFADGGRVVLRRLGAA